MRLLTKDEKKIYADLVKFKRRHTVPHKCCMAEHAPEGFDKA